MPALAPAAAALGRDAARVFSPLRERGEPRWLAAPFSGAIRHHEAPAHHRVADGAAAPRAPPPAQRRRDFVIRTEPDGRVTVGPREPAPGSLAAALAALVGGRNSAASRDEPALWNNWERAERRRRFR
jgi:hypothetical protein